MQGSDEDKNNMHNKGKKATIVYDLNPSSQLLFEDALKRCLNKYGGKKVPLKSPYAPPLHNSPFGDFPKSYLPKKNSDYNLVDIESHQVANASSNYPNNKHAKKKLVSTTAFSSLSKVTTDKPPKAGAFAPRKIPVSEFRLHYDITGGDNTTMEANIKSRLFAPQFSHELGHYAINTGQDKESKKVFDKLVKLENEKKSSNFLGKIYKQHLKNKYTRKNESNASRNGLEILKQVGANQSELDLAKEVYDKAGKSYETSQKYKLLRDIGDRINIKDRRNTRVMYRGGEPVHVGMTKFKLERRKKK